MGILFLYFVYDYVVVSFFVFEIWVAQLFGAVYYGLLGGMIGFYGFQYGFCDGSNGDYWPHSRMTFSACFFPFPFAYNVQPFSGFFQSSSPLSQKPFQPFSGNVLAFCSFFDRSEMARNPLG